MSTERRPYPPLGFTNPENFRPYIAIIPANEVYSWASDNLLMENGKLHNEDHFHFHTADIAFMWARGVMSSVNAGRRCIAPVAGRGFERVLWFTADG